MAPLSGPGVGKSRLGSNRGGNPMRLAIILCVVSIVLFTISCRDGGTGPLSAVRGGFTLITTPVRVVGAVVSTPFTGVGNVVSNLTADQETLSDLKAKNSELQAKVVELTESSQDSSRYEKLLELKNSYNLQSTGARRISGSTDTWSDTITIDKGSSSGLAVGMPVCDQNGIIGQISECGLTSSVVRLITDEGSSVSAMIQSSRAQGMLVGQPDGSLSLTLVGTDQQVAVGDTVITSGLGGVYPKGLPIGTVTSVEKSSGALYYTINVQLFNTSNTFEEVIVITSLTEDQQATSEDAAAADALDAAAASSAASVATPVTQEAATTQTSQETTQGEGE